MIDYLSEYRDFLKELAELSGREIMKHYRSDITVISKEDDSPVTIADRNAETCLRDAVSKRFSSHGIIGEEFENYHENAEFVWVFDPIDGTKSFISGVPLFMTLVALLHNGEPVLGMLHQPVTGELMIGDGHNTYLNDQKVAMRPLDNLSEAVLLTTDWRDTAKHKNNDRFNNLLNRVSFARTWGDAYGYFLLASGRADIMIDPQMNFWDLAALVPVIRGAGGVITDYEGGNPVTADSIIAANQVLHDRVISTLNG